MNKQTVKPELLIVLGKDHGADLTMLDKKKISYVFCDSDKMGKLRNAGIKESKTDWVLYFSVDDELLPHACEEILSFPSRIDCVSLDFDTTEIDGTERKGKHSPCINSLTDLVNWKSSWGGYVAVRGFKNIMFDEEIEVPNLTYHFELYKERVNIVRSKTSCAIHHRRGDSHHYRTIKTENHRKLLADMDRAVNKMVKEEIKGTRRVAVIKVLSQYKDRTLLSNQQILRGNKRIIPMYKRLKEGDIYKVYADRAIYLVDNGVAKYNRIYD